jgi:3'-phosphoadenosine 5'-phosphosulfate sulfotransferase (PAPS reductase)/FAD synthetase
MGAVLQFGGGKDSWACLYLLRDQWSSLTVAFLNTGAAFPETLEQIERIRPLVQVLEVRSNVLANVENHGWPTDVLPVRNAHQGKLTTGEPSIMLQTWWSCCSANFWEPLHRATLQLGATTIYRGQRLTEDYKSTLRDGDVIDGVTYRFPLQGWTEAQVSEYLNSQGVEIPAHYAHTQKSLDCWCCTAYLDAKLDQLRYLRDRHPEKYAIVADRLREMRGAVRRASEPLLATDLEGV